MTEYDELYFDERVILQMMMSSSRTAAHFSGRRNQVILKLENIEATRSNLLIDFLKNDLICLQHPARFLW